MPLAPVLVERPGGDDAPLSLLGQPVDPRRDPRQQRLAAALASQGERARAVDRGPHDLGADVLRDPRRGDEAVVAPRHAPGVDLEAVPLGAGAADEALVELGRSPTRRRARAASTASSKLGGDGGETAGSPGRASATSASPSCSSTRSPSRVTASGRSSGGGSRSVTSTAGAPTAWASNPAA